MIETVAMAVMGFQENGTVDTDDYFQDTKSITEVKKQYQKDVETRMVLMNICMKVPLHLRMICSP